MKKFLMAILAFTLLATSLVSCSGKEWDETKIEEYIQGVIDEVEFKDNDFENLVTKYCAGMEINELTASYHLGSSEYEYKKAYVYEPLLGSVAFSMGMIVTETKNEAKILAEDLKNSLLPNKWLCVSVDKSDVKTTSNGNLVFFVMSEYSDDFIAAFEKMAK